MAKHTPIQTVIMVPSQGDAFRALQDSAGHVARVVYESHAVVYTTTYHPDNSVSFAINKTLTPKSALAHTKNFHTDSKHCHTFVYMGHNGYMDGPILAYDHHNTHPQVSADELNPSQPWQVEPSFQERYRLVEERAAKDPHYHHWGEPDQSGNENWGKDFVNVHQLSPQGGAFWKNICHSSKGKGKIVIYGCNSGVSYTSAISAVNQNGSLYGAKDQCSPANKFHAVEVLSQIKHGKTPPGWSRLKALVH